MKVHLEELASLVEGELVGDPRKKIEGLAGLEEAGPSDISFLSDPKLEGLLASTRAGAVVIAPELRDKAPCDRILVKDPRLAFLALLRLWEKKLAPKRPPGIHPAAVVSPYAVVGKDAHVGPLAVMEHGSSIGERTRLMAQCYLGHDARLGKDCVVYPGVVIREGCVIGDRVILHPGVVIGSDGYGFLPREGRHLKIPQIGRVVIEDDVEIQAGSHVARAALGETRIGRGTKIDALVHVAHNARIGEDCLLLGCAALAGSVSVGRGATIGGQASLPDHVKIGEGAILGGLAAPISDVPAGAVMFGIPARTHGEFFKMNARLNRLGELFETVKELKKLLSDKGEGKTKAAGGGAST